MELHFIIPDLVQISTEAHSVIFDWEPENDCSTRYICPMVYVSLGSGTYTAASASRIMLAKFTELGVLFK